MPDANFVDPVVPQKKSFVKVKDYFKTRVIALNPEAASIDFTDLEATVKGAERKIVLSLKSDHKNRYVLANPVEFTYSDIDFNGLMTTVLGFVQTYSKHQKDAVIAALPEGLTNEWVESESKLKISVTATANAFQFDGADATLVTALFQGGTFAISFVDDAIDLATKLTNTHIDVVLADLVEG